MLFIRRQHLTSNRRRALCAAVSMTGHGVELKGNAALQPRGRPPH